MVGRLFIAALLIDAASLVSALAGGKDAGKRRHVKAAAHQVPEVTDALKQPQRLFESMSSQMTELQQSLMAAKTDSQVAVKKKREVYEQKLGQQRERNEATTRFNQNLAARINSMTEDNLRLRERAHELEAQSTEVTSDLEELRDNVTLAHEYLDRVLNDSHISLHEASEVSILSELDQEDVNLTQHRLHENNLEEIGDAGKLAMIQLSAGEQPKAEDAMPKELLETLLASWDGISNEQNTSEVSLGAAFEEEYGAGDERYQALLQNQVQLNATMAERMGLNQNLTAAVTYLEKTYDHLLEQRTSLRQFARRLSKRPLPAVQLLAKLAPPPKKPSQASLVTQKKQTKQSHNSAKKEKKTVAPIVAASTDARSFEASARGAPKETPSIFTWLHR